MAENNENTTDKYLKYAGFAFLGGFFVFMIAKVMEGKRNNNVVNSLTAKAELKRITETPAQKPIVAPVAPVTTVVPPVVTPTTPDAGEDKVITGEMRESAFKEDGKEDVAKPTIVQIVKEKPELNDTGKQMPLPINAVVGRPSEGDAFGENDVVYSYGVQQGRLARKVAGNYVFVDNAGNPLGSFKSNNMQKLGIITRKEPNGFYFKISPDWKKQGFIGYEQAYKLT